MKAIFGAQNGAKKMITDYRLSFFGLIFCFKHGLFFCPATPDPMAVLHCCCIVCYCTGECLHSLSV